MTDSLINNIFSILLQVLFIFIFINIFFFSYMQKLEKQKMNDIIISIVDEIFQDCQKSKKTKLLVNDTISFFEKRLENIPRKNTNEINHKMINMIMVLTIIVVLLGIYLYFSGNIVSFKYFLKQAIITVILISITEIIFTYLIAKNYSYINM